MSISEPVTGALLIPKLVGEGLAESLASPARADAVHEDIGSNLGDPVFRGSYHGKQAHPDDFDAILKRAKDAGVFAQVLTADCLKGAKEVLGLAKAHSGLYSTVGCHPCRAQEFEAFEGGPEGYIKALSEVIESNLGGKKGKGKVVAIGETGLDYDRLALCPKDVQLKYFPPQLELASKFDLPLFLHSRAAHADFVNLVKAHGKPLRGVVHSHSGTFEEAQELIDMGFFIGIKCSLKTPESLDCVSRLPLDHLLVESDCPWCEIRPSHASHPHLATLPPELKPLYLPPAVKKERWSEGKAIKTRNEACATGAVAWVLAELKGVDVQEVARITTKNAVELFGLDENV